MSISNIQAHLVCFTVQVTLTAFEITKTTRTILAFISLGYAIPSFILLLRIFYILIKLRNGKEFSNSFYTLFIAGSIVDIFWWIFNYYVNNAHFVPLYNFLYKWMHITGFPVKVFYFFNYYLFLANLFVPIVLSANRFTASFFPIKHERLWTKPFIFLIIVFLFTFPAIFSWKLLVVTVFNCKIVDPDDKKNIRYSFIYSEQTEPTNWINIDASRLTIEFTSMGICIIMNMLTMFSMIKQRKRGGSKNHEIRPFILSFANFFANLCLELIQIATLMLTVQVPISIFNVSAMQIGYNFACDLICLSPPWILLFTHGIIRKNLFWIKTPDPMAMVIHQPATQNFMHNRIDITKQPKA